MQACVFKYTFSLSLSLSLCPSSTLSLSHSLSTSRSPLQGGCRAGRTAASPLWSDTNGVFQLSLCQQHSKSFLQTSASFKIRFSSPRLNQLTQCVSVGTPVICYINLCLLAHGNVDGCGSLYISSHVDAKKTLLFSVLLSSLSHFITVHTPVYRAGKTKKQG